MNQRDLECFVKVVDAGSFSQAAILLGRPQPALSRHIRDLETDLNTTLLYRNGRGVVLTEAGRRLYTRATTILTQIAEARAEVMARGGLTAASIGMPASLSRILAAPLAAALEAAHPGIGLRFTDACNGHLLEWLADSRLDVALLYATEASQRLSAEPLISEPMHLIRRAGGERAPATVPAAGLTAHALVLPGRQHGLRQQATLWAMRNGIELRIRAECDGFASLLELVMSGVGATILPATSVRLEIERGLLQASLIVDPVFSRQIVLATPANRPSMKDLLRAIRRQVRGLDQATGWSAVEPPAPQGGQVTGPS
ncbi:LysR family transcriptional regulator [Roseomonas sp. OT10]|uniref:LysR family transcriptional regulator n=1 Tax=Roseomonas cutis TaxID=2897332 RepID=UPI001E5FC2EF|nr:LysR family transcriptional regulator [Roseomonas sp. OT10]UFN48851.1 LysR family transcriptional regulator [Roseomonas sp. OT10]